MSFWIREIVGWLLLIVGLIVFYFCLELWMDRAIIEAGPLTVIGIVIFRGGIHLLKVAAAARICREARRKAVEQKPRTPARAPARPGARVNPLSARGS